MQALQAVADFVAYTNANPNKVVAFVFLGLMLAICIAGFFMSNEPTPEYTRMMAEIEERRVQWEADRPAREEKYRQEREERHAKYRAESLARLEVYKEHRELADMLVREDKDYAETKAGRFVVNFGEQGVWLMRADWDDVSIKLEYAETLILSAV